MFKKKNRLKKTKDFDNVFKKGKTIAGKLVFLKIIKNKTDISRVGFIVSLKISKRATIRNKLKRQLRAIIKANFSDFKPGFDIITIAKPEIVNNKYQDIKEEIGNLLNKAKIL
jgi:ribonuclease P protein component